MILEVDPDAIRGSIGVQGDLGVRCVNLRRDSSAWVESCRPALLNVQQPLVDAGNSEEAVEEAV
jgi:hypothetical protein